MRKQTGLHLPLTQNPFGHRLYGLHMQIGAHAPLLRTYRFPDLLLIPCALPFRHRTPDRRHRRPLWASSPMLPVLRSLLPEAVSHILSLFLLPYKPIYLDL